MGSQTATPKGPDGKAPMLYSRLTTGAEAFAAQRNVAAKQGRLDGGGTVAAGADGRVWVTWHGGGTDETNRAVWAAESRDGGATFAAERQVSAAGVCACCGIESAVDADGLQVLYRSVNAATGTRDAVWLHGAVGAKQMPAETLGAWPIKGCPMSTSALLPGAAGLRLAWENENRIEYRGPDVATTRLDFGAGRSFKHPALAVNAAGETLVVVAVNTSWNAGGTVAWLVLDGTGKTLGTGTSPGLPASSRPAAWANPDGGFTVLY
jgi:hypothetical protein